MVKMNDDEICTVNDGGDGDYDDDDGDNDCDDGGE